MEGRTTNHKPMISIIMPVYNAADYLDDTLGDIITQTYKDFELICVNDGSTDGSRSILDDYANEHIDTITIHQGNQGAGVARNVGIEMAKGEYLLFLDADDRFESNMLEAIVREAERTECDVLIFGGDAFNTVTGKTETTPWLIGGQAGKIVGNPFYATNTTIWNKLFKKEYIENLGIRFQDIRIAETMSFVAMALLGMKKGIIINDILVHYRRGNANSAISQADKYPLGIYLALKETYKEIKKRDYLLDSLPYFYDFAMENIRIRLDMLNEWAAYIELYSCLHNGGLDEIGLTSELEHPEVYKDWNFIQNIRKYDAQEYLFYRMKELRVREFTDVTSFDISDNLLDTCKEHTVLLHGGGMVGRGYVRRLMRLGVNISAWSDGRAKEPGYPITSIDDAITKPFDFVLLAVESDQVAESMRKDFVVFGVDPDKILWEPPIRI